MIELWDKWTEYHTGRGKTIPDNYKNAFRYCAALHQKRFVDITTAQIQATVDAVSDKPHTAVHVRMIFGLLYKYARLINLTETNRAQGVEVPTLPKSTKHKPFSAEELETLWEQAEDYGVQPALVYCYTRLRPSELIEIKRENVHLAERYMVGGMKTEAGRNRTIPIAEKIVPIIESFLSRPSAFLLTTPDGKHPPDRDTLHNMYWKKSASHIVRAHLPHDGAAHLRDDAGQCKGKQAHHPAYHRPRGGRRGRALYSQDTPPTHRRDKQNLIAYALHIKIARGVVTTGYYT